MTRRFTGLPDDRDHEIRRLKDELYVTRTAIINLMPEPKRDLLDCWIYCDTFKDVHEWERWAIDQLVRLADAQPGPEMGDWPGTLRAYCPLCGRGAQSMYLRGFSLPTGLEWHLEGSRRCVRCSVFKAAAEMCYERVREKEREKEQGKPQPNRSALGDRPLPPWKAKPDEGAAAPLPASSSLVIKLRST